MLLGEIKRILSRPIFYITLIVGMFIINRPLLEGMCAGTMGAGSISQYLSIPFAMSDFTPFAALFCTLPFADSFCEDYNTGYYRLVIHRSGTNKYAFLRCFSVAFSGGIVMSGIILATIIICALLSDMPDTPETVDFMRNSIWFRSGIIFVMNGLPYSIMRVLFAFIFGNVWSLIGLVLSAILPNKYITVIAPFVIYQCLWFVLDETKWNPVYLLRGDSNYIPSISFVIMYQTINIILLFISSFLLIRKKVRI